MAADLGTSLGALGLLVGFPLLLLAGLWVLGSLEAWMLRPYERAAEIERLLAQENEADAVEEAVIRVVAEVADDPRMRQGRGSLIRSGK